MCKRVAPTVVLLVNKELCGKHKLIKYISKVNLFFLVNYFILQLRTRSIWNSPILFII